MDAGGGADDAFVLFQASAVGEVEGVAVDVGDEAACFGGDEGSCGVVPDSFDVVLFCGESEVGVGLAAGGDGVFGLGVESGGFAGGVAVGGEVVEDSVGVVGVGVCFFDGGADGDRFALVVVESVDLGGFVGAVGGAVVGGVLEDAVALYGGVDGAVGVWEVEGSGELAGEVWASEDADCGCAAFDVGEGDGVLLVSEEALCAIDGVEGPEAGVVGVSGADVDGVEEGVFGGVRPDGLDGGERGLAVGGVVGVAEELGVLLADEDDGGAETLAKDPGDDGLGGEVGDGDGGLVVLGDGAEVL